MDQLGGRGWRHQLLETRNLNATRRLFRPPVAFRRRVNAPPAHSSAFIFFSPLPVSFPGRHTYTLAFTPYMNLNSPLHPIALFTVFPSLCSIPLSSPPFLKSFLFFCVCFEISCLKFGSRESKKMNAVRFYVFPIVALVLMALFEGSRGQGTAPSPAPAGPLSDGRTIDQGIAYVLLIVALVVTYLVH